MAKVIDSFSGEYAFLSNFYPSPLEIYVGREVGMVTFPTVEHLFQACKLLHSNLSEKEIGEKAVEISRLPSPGDAKRAGRKIEIDVELWDSKSVSYMEWALMLKFNRNPDLRALLRDTGDAVLVEGNTWGDRIWGQVGGEGENRLGRLLMYVRDVYCKD